MRFFSRFKKEMTARNADYKCGKANSGHEKDFLAGLQRFRQMTSGEI